MSKAPEIKPNEHVVVPGQNGSGKTFLARKYLAGFPYVVALDTKGDLEWPEIPKEKLTLVDSIADLPAVQTPYIIYRPRWQELEPEYYDAFFAWIYRRRNCIVWVDEAMSVSPNPGMIPPHYKACLTRGRSLGIGVWSLTQRPSGIAQVILSEAKHYFVFNLTLPQDRKKMVEITGQTEMFTLPGERNFWYYRSGEKAPVLAHLVERRIA